MIDLICVLVPKHGALQIMVGIGRVVGKLERSCHLLFLQNCILWHAGLAFQVNVLIRSVFARRIKSSLNFIWYLPRASRHLPDKCLCDKISVSSLTQVFDLLSWLHDWCDHEVLLLRF